MRCVGGCVYMAVTVYVCIHANCNRNHMYPKYIRLLWAGPFTCNQWNSSIHPMKYCFDLPISFCHIVLLYPFWYSILGLLGRNHHSPDYIQEWNQARQHNLDRMMMVVYKRHSNRSNNQGMSRRIEGMAYFDLIYAWWFQRPSI